MQRALACTCRAVSHRIPRPASQYVLPRRTLATVVDVPARKQPRQQGSKPAKKPVKASTSSPMKGGRTRKKGRGLVPGKRLELADIPSRRAPEPVPEELQNIAQRIYLPNIVIKLIRNSPAEAQNPYIATFRVPVQLTKPDIVSYLLQVYGLEITSINTVIEMGELVKRTPGTYKSHYRKKATKKAIVGLKEPFWYPDKQSEEWLNYNFEKEQRKHYVQRRLLPGGDQSLGRARKSWRWRGSHPEVQGVGARYNQILKRVAERRKEQETLLKELTDEERAAASKAVTETAS